MLMKDQEEMGKPSKRDFIMRQLVVALKAIRDDMMITNFSEVI